MSGRSDRQQSGIAESERRDRRAAAACLRFCAGVGYLFLLAGLSGAPARAQAPGTPGPQRPPANPPVIVRIPNTPAAPAPPAMPAAEIIRRFAAQEDELAKAAAGYVYRKSVRLQEFGVDGKPSGEAEIVTTPTIGEDGRRYQRASGEQQSTLQVVDLNRDELQALTELPAFPLGSAQLSKYQISYEGMEPLDELTTYIFRVKPVQVERTRPYFDGLVWVDNHDLVIVKTYGKWVTETGDWSPPGLPALTMYETYREPVDNKYWLPAYSRSDGTVKTRNGDVPVRLVIRWDQYAPAPPGTAAAPDTDSDVPRLRRNSGAQQLR